MLPVNSTDSKSSRVMWDILKGKQPDLQEVDLLDSHCSAFEIYNNLPKVLPLNITSRDFMVRVKKTGGGSRGMSGTYYHMLNN